MIKKSISNLFFFFCYFCLFIVFSSCSRQGSVTQRKRVEIKEPHFFAHYMPWFGLPEKNREKSWYNWKWPGKKPYDRNPDRVFPGGKRDLAATYYPVIGPYESSDENLIEYHILLAKLSGIDGFVVNWYGFEDMKGVEKHENLTFRKLLAAAEKLDFLVCVDIDDKCMFPPYTAAKTREESVRLAKKTVERICKEYGISRAYFKIDGRPVITNFGWDIPLISGKKATAFGPAEWKKIMASARRHNPFFIHDYQYHWKKSIRDTGFLSSADGIYSWVTGVREQMLKFYKESAELLEKGEISIITGQMNPGFDNIGTGGWGMGRSVISREDGRLYRETFEDSIKAGAKWVQIITWNDFAEGSTIEPAAEYGYKYLELTRELISGVKKIVLDKKFMKFPERIYKVNDKINMLRNNRESDKKLLDSLSDETAGIVLSINSGKETDIKMPEKKISSIEKSLATEERRLGSDARLLITLSPEKKTVYPGDEIRMTASVRNLTKKAVQGLFLVNPEDIPSQWIKWKKEEMLIHPAETRRISFSIKIPENASNDRYYMSAAVNAFKMYNSPVSEINVRKRIFFMDITDQNILIAGKKNDLFVRISFQDDKSVTGNLKITVPGACRISGSDRKINLSRVSDTQFAFSITPEKPGRYEIKCSVKTDKNYEYRESFLAIDGKNAGLVEGDLNNDGYSDVSIGNNLVETLVTKAAGGRILTLFLKETGKNILFTKYPGPEPADPARSEAWVEFGGINDIFPGGFPGEAWNNAWEYKVFENTKDKVSVSFFCPVKSGLYIERKMTLPANSDTLKLDYRIKNNSGSPREILWSSHPDLAPGGTAGPEDVIEIRTTSGVKKRNFLASQNKYSFTPADSLALAYDSGTGEFFRMKTDLAGVECGIWEGKDFFTAEFIMKPETLRPGSEKIFTVEYTAGKKLP